MQRPQLRGTGVALVTPFQQNGAIDFDALERIIEHVISGGAEYLVSLGTTGESVTLTSAECREIISFTIKVVNERVPIVGGMFGGNWTSRLEERIRTFDFEGLSAILSSNPAYNKPTQEGIYQHYMKVAEVSPLPVIIYNVPGRTSSTVEPETLVRLAESSSKFCAVKEASGDMVKGLRLLKNKPDHFQVLSGDDPTAMLMCLAGGDGVISVIGNALPGPFSNMIRAALDGNLAEAKRLNDEVMDLHHHLYAEGNPAGIKGLLEMMGMCGRHVRLPLVPQTESGQAKMQKVFEAIYKATSLVL